MKANEAPEKIYLQVCGDCDDNDCKNCKFKDLEDNLTWCKDQIFDKDIEYTRTDAFINKACEYINKLIDIPHNIEYADNGEPLAGSYIDYAKERLEAANKIIEEFRKYMKGE